MMDTIGCCNKEASIGKQVLGSEQYGNTDENELTCNREQTKLHGNMGSGFFDPHNGHNRNLQTNQKSNITDNIHLHDSRDYSQHTKPSHNVCNSTEYISAPSNNRMLDNENTHNQSGVFVDRAKYSGNVSNIRDARNQPTRQLHNRKLKEPDLFDGNRTEWPDYICHFEQVAQWNQWTDREKAAQLAMSLRGVAQRVLSELSSDALCHYDTLKSTLMQRFCPPERETAHRCEFRNRRRSRNETAAEYGYALKRLGSHAFPSIPLTMRESLIVEQYISGLGNAEIQRHVQFAHPTTLDRAISLAVEFEAFEGTQIYPRKPKDFEQMPVLALTTSDREKYNKPPENAKIAYLEDSIKDIQQSLKTVMEKMDKNHNRHNSARSSRGNFKQRKPVICFHCEKEGHFMRDCPDLQNGYSASSSHANHKQNGQIQSTHGRTGENLN